MHGNMHVTSVCVCVVLHIYIYTHTRCTYTYIHMQGNMYVTSVCVCIVFHIHIHTLYICIYTLVCSYICLRMSVSMHSLFYIDMRLERRVLEAELHRYASFRSHPSPADSESLSESRLFLSNGCPQNESPAILASPAGALKRQASSRTPRGCPHSAQSPRRAAGNLRHGMQHLY